MAKSVYSDIIRSYFKTGCLNSTDRMLSFIDYRIPYFKNSKKIFSIYKTHNILADAIQQEIKVAEYTHTNPFALEMKQFLEKNLRGKYSGAYTHGSLGTNEIISYSDFDGLIILNHSAFKSVKDVYSTAIALKKSEHIMKKMDPLQHHGWFIITENELRNYPADYFPPMLFDYAKCISGERNFHITYQSSSSDELKKHFTGFCKHLISNIQKISDDTNFYDLKSTLSGFMLLPAIFLQLKHPEGVFKKDSFELIQKEMSEKEYQVMNLISRMRVEWKYTSPGRYKFLLQSNNALLNHYFYKKWSGTIPLELTTKLISLKPDMLNFVRTLIAKTESEI